VRGVNFGGWFSQVDAIQEKDPEHFVDLPSHVETFIGSRDFDRVKSWGFDHVRLPVDYFNVFDEQLRPNERVLRLLDTAIEESSHARLNVILDLHKCPGHDFLEGCSSAQDFFSSEVKREESKRVWRYLAGRYGTASHVMFEILNEPVAEDSAAWDAVKNELAAVIRSHAPHSTIVVGSNRWNSPSEFAHLTPLRDDNVIYSFHFYAPLLFTHQRAPWLHGECFEVTRAYPGEYTLPPGTVHRLPLEVGLWNRERIRRELDPVFRFREEHRVQVACNEFGVFVGGAARDSQLRWMQDFVSVLNDGQFGFSYWNYKNLDFGLVSDGERAYANFAQYQNAERVDQELVSVLTR
jgi:hypothetical protein